MTGKNVIIIGASSGIGRELAKVFSARGYAVGMTARRFELLQELAKELTGVSFARRMDAAQPEAAVKTLEELIAEMGHADMIVINAGIGFRNPDLEWQKEKDTIAVNAAGFSALAGSAMKYFLKRGQGHLAGVSSITAIRGSSISPAYSASKVFIAHYLDALRLKAYKMKLPVRVTHIQPGFVDTAMGQGKDAFWSASAAEAARQIADAIEKKKPHAYITKRWCLIAWILRLIPARLLAKFY